MSAIVIEAFAAGCSSCMLVGKPRLGKTYAARWICEAINDLLGPVTWIEVPFEDDRTRSCDKFASIILECIPHKYRQKKKTDRAMQILVEFLVERARESPLGTVILLLDEAQCLTETHWTFLAKISNKIDAENLSLFTLSTGQPSLYITRNTLRELPAHQDGDFILGRFFMDVNDFRGLRSLEDAHLTLEQYSLSPFEPNCDSYWLERALPLAYQAGWRLERCSDVLWEALAGAWTQAGRETAIEVPMTHFDLLVKQILSSPEQFNCEKPRIDLATARDLVTKSKFEAWAR